MASNVNSSGTTCLITGANLQTFLSRPEMTVIALVRDPSHQTSHDLSKLQKGANSKLIVIAYDASIESSPVSAISELQDKHKITSLDMVIANSGMINYFGDFPSIKSENFLEHITVNTLGPIHLVQATLPLMERSSVTPKFITISSAIGSTGLIPTLSRGSAIPYGMSKVAVNHVMVKLSILYPNIIVGLITPGRVLTDFGGMRAVNSPHAVAIEDSVRGIVKLIDGATIENMSGKFYEWNGDVVPW